MLTMNLTLMREGTLHLHIANWFYDGTSTFFMVLEQVVPRVKLCCSTSSSCVVHVLGLKIRHT